MVLGLKSKHKKGVPIEVEYIVHVHEVSPWPPSESYKHLQTVLLQWENGTQNSGSFLSVPGHSNIAFNENFMLPLRLKRDKKATDKFRKNYLEFSLYEPRKEKAKGQLIGTAVLNVADYVLTDDVTSINVPFNFKKISNDSGQPALAISMEIVEKDSANSSPSVGLSNEMSLDNDDEDGSEVASYTDDDASSHSSRTTGSSRTVGSSMFETGYGTDPTKDRSGSLYTSSADTSPSKPFSKFSERSMTYVKKNNVSPLIRSSPSSISFRDTTNAMFNNTSLEDKSHTRFAYHEDSLDEHVVPNRKGPAIPQPKARLKHAKSIQIHKGNGFLSEGKQVDVDIPSGAPKKNKLSAFIGRSDSKNETDTRVEMLEEELREAAAIELALFCVVAEHSTSGNKVHAPARRLSRFYRNTCKTGPQSRRASAARAAVSGLLLVSKASGYDVPRLTFWLSNSIMLRAIVSQTAAELPDSRVLESTRRQSKSFEETDNWEDVMTVIMALEKVESWLFSRIVESVWWQTFTPHMQPAVAKRSKNTSSTTKKNNGRRNNLGNHEQGSFSIELWKKAFRDAREKICPIRAGGHECGCLSALVILVMEQLVNRLDVAMFNAILRESSEDMPGDPLSDPISDSIVLPIPVGKSSFGNGAQLKNVIGNWSRWLSDLFGLEDDSTEDSGIVEVGQRRKPFKAFRLLHALSDLMMLPFEMLADVSTRKEVCPMFGPRIIKRVLNNFVPDEFFPDPIPQSIIEALNSEEISDSSPGIITSFPCSASPTKYSHPPAALLTCVGEVGTQVLKSNRLSTLKKSYTSDDDLDQLHSPLTSIIPDSDHNTSALAKLSFMPKEKGGRNVLRYQLLREIWRDDES